MKLLCLLGSLLLAQAASASDASSWQQNGAVNAVKVGEPAEVQSLPAAPRSPLEERLAGPSVPNQDDAYHEWILVQATINGKAAKAALLAELGKVAPRAKVVASVAKRGLTISKVHFAEKRAVGYAQKLRGQAGIVAAAPNYRRQFYEVPDDPLFAQQWSLQNQAQTGGLAGADIGAVQAWDHATGSRGVLLAIIDSGVAYDLPDFVANMWHNPGEIPGNGVDDDGNGYVDDVVGYDFGEGDADPYDRVGHGTHVAGIAGAVGNNGVGIAGVSRQVSLMALKIADAEGALDDFAIVQAILYAVDMGARIINASWGGPVASEVLETVLRETTRAGILFVTAAGNNGSSLVEAQQYPASYELDNILVVAATDNQDQRPIFSNYSAEQVDIAAPGVAILSTQTWDEAVIHQDFQSVQPPNLPADVRVEDASSAWVTVLSEGRGGKGNVALRPGSESKPYAGNAHATLYLPTIALVPGNDYRLTFNGVLDAGSGEVLYIEFRDGASGNLVSQWRLRNTRDLASYTRVEIPAPVGPASIAVNFLWISDDVDNDHYGVELDDIRLGRRPYTLQDDPRGEPQYALKSGTSMAAPHVAGAAAVILGEFGPLDLPALWMRLTGAADVLDSLATSTVGGRRLNLERSLTASGGLDLRAILGDASVEVSEGMQLLWTYFDQPDCPLTLTLMKGDKVVTTILRNHTGLPQLLWRVPLLPPGDGYRLRLTGCGQTATSAPFSIEETEFLTIKDPNFQAFAEDVLDLDGDGRVSAFEARTVFSLNCSGRNIQQLPDLSMFPKLSILDCSKNNLSRLPELAGLPLFSLDCSKNQIESLPALPPDLYYLYCQHNRLTELPDLSHLELAELNLSDNLLTEIPSLLPGNYLILLDLSQNKLTSLPDLPEGLFQLACYGNALTSLPELPAQLSALACDYNQLEALPPLPEDIRLLTFEGNRITSEPANGWPTDLFYLNCSGNPLATTPDWSNLPGLQHVFALDTGFERAPAVSTERVQGPNGVIYLPLRVLHMNGNRLSEEDCGEMEALEALNLTDFPYFAGSLRDGLLFRRRQDGSILNCGGGADAVTPIAEISLREEEGRHYLSWQAGGGEFHPIDSYQVLVDDQPMGRTTALSLALEGLVPGETARFRVIGYQDDQEVVASEAFDLIVPEPVRPVRVFPIEQGPGEHFGLALTNGSRQPQDIALVARNAAGAVLGRAEIQGLGPGKKRKGGLADFFGRDLPPGTALLELQAWPEVRCVALFGNPGGRDASPGLPLTHEGSMVVLDQYYPTFQTRIGMAAPEPATVTLEARDGAGQQLAVVQDTVVGLRERALGEIFEPGLVAQIRLLEWHSEGPMACYQRGNFSSAATSASTFSGNHPAAGLRGVMTVGSFRANKLVHVSLYNPNPFRSWVDFQSYDREGQLRGKISFRLEAQESRNYYATYILPFGANDSMAEYRATAPIHVSFDDDRIVENQFGDRLPLQSRYGRDRLMVPTTFGERFLVPHVPYNAAWWTEIVVHNAGDTAIPLTLIARSDNGAVLETLTRHLPAKGTLRDFSQNLFKKATAVASLEILGSEGAELAVQCFYHPTDGEALTSITLPPLGR